MANLIETILGALPAGTIDSIATNLGESPQATGSALGGVIPVILGSMAGKAESGGAGGVVDMIRSVLAGGNPLDNPDAVAAGVANGSALGGGGIAASLLGGSFGPVAAMLAERFGLKLDSIKALLGLGGALSAGGIGRLLGGNPTPEGLASLLAAERPAITSALPAGVAGLLGSFGGAASGAAADFGDAAAAAGSGMGKWLPWLLAALAILALVVGLKTCKRDEAVTVGNTTELAITNEIAPVVPAPVPTGSGVVAEMRGALPALIVYFDVGKSEVSKDLSTAASGVKDYVAANPGARLAVSGYNDPTGNAAANAELSKNRAQQVAAALEAAGIPADAISLEKPADTSGTGTTDAESRRVEVTVKQ